MPINMIGSWDTLKCMTWNVLCSLSFQGQGEKGPFGQTKFDFPINPSPNYFIRHRVAGPPGAGDLAELGTQHTLKTRQESRCLDVQLGVHFLRVSFTKEEARPPVRDALVCLVI